MAGLNGHNFSQEWEDISGMLPRGGVRRKPPNTLPLQPTYQNHTYVTQTGQTLDEAPDADEEYKAAVRRYVEIAVSIATLITENLLSHPFVVLRRQCQVQSGTKRWHMTPVTLLPVIIRLHQRQGVGTLWKGLGSSLLVRGHLLAVDDCLSKFTPWPKNISLDAPCKTFCQHLLLKSISLAIVTPFYSASLVETVQSDIASEKPGLFDVLKEGLFRCVSVGAARGRMLPMWSLIPISVTHGVVKYLVSLTVRSAAAWTIHMQIRAQQVRRGALNKDVDSEENMQKVEVTASFIGMVTAEIVCYPLETILHRLHLQGTRTIVDQLDNGTEVIPILTAYSGVADCYADAIAKEGFGGLYRGFGALLAQIAVHWAVIRLTRSVVSWGATVFHPPPPPQSYTPLTQPVKGSAAPTPGEWAPLMPVAEGGWPSQRPATPLGDWQAPQMTSTPVSTPVNPYMTYRRRDSHPNQKKTEEEGTLTQTKGKGASGSFKLSTAEKSSEKKTSTAAKKTSAKKPAAARSAKPAAKKLGTTKKTTAASSPAKPKAKKVVAAAKAKSSPKKPAPAAVAVPKSPSKAKKGAKGAPTKKPKTPKPKKAAAKPKTAAKKVAPKKK